jgi:hypothetical protein
MSSNNPGVNLDFFDRVCLEITRREKAGLVSGIVAEKARRFAREEELGGVLGEWAAADVCLAAVRRNANR